jgi:hypothetical protein
MHARSIVAALALAGLLAVSTPPVAAQTPTPMPGYPPQPDYVTDSCFWGSPLNWHVPEQNTQGPDTLAIYWYVRYQLPPHAVITLKGDFAHARHLSFTTYKTVNGEPGTENTFLTDVEIAPDQGSVNPYFSGVDRSSPNRAFTVTLSPEPPPASDPAPNTLYTGSEGTTDEVQTVEMIERLYVPDHYPADLAGGEPPPTLTMTTEDGTTTEGQAVCDALGVINGTENLDKAGGLPDGVYTHLRDLGALGHPAVVPPLWEKYVNTKYMLKPFLAGTVLAPLIQFLPTATLSSFYTNPGNKYVIAYGDRRLGPDPDGHNVLVFTGKMPTTPATVDGEQFADFDTAQVRYWSLCNFGSIALSVNGPANTDCLYDQQVPTDADGNFTIVVSLPEDRPVSATTECGVGWMDWTLKGDGIGDQFLDMFMVRNMLSNPDFAESIQNTTPGTEQEVMGPYYPVGSYMTPAEFDEQSSCTAVPPPTTTTSAAPPTT